jgi:glycogen debranching enzyme
MLTRPQYVRLPPAYTPYVLRVALDAGTPASKNGVFKTNFPLDGGRFERTTFCERRSVPAAWRGARPR